MPPFDPAAAVGEHVHGHLGWLAAVALIHPAISLRQRERRAHLSVALAAGLATPAGALGAALYPAYRERVKPPIFIHAPGVGTSSSARSIWPSAPSSSRGRAP